MTLCSLPFRCTLFQVEIRPFECGARHRKIVFTLLFENLTRPQLFRARNFQFACDIFMFTRARSVRCAVNLVRASCLCSEGLSPFSRSLAAARLVLFLRRDLSARGRPCVLSLLLYSLCLKRHAPFNFSGSLPQVHSHDCVCRVPIAVRAAQSRWLSRRWTPKL